MAPFDSELTTKISPLIEGQVPDYIQADNPKFVEFLKQYYQFLEAAELNLDGIINNIILENTDLRYLKGEDDTKIVAETGVGTTGKFIVGETIRGNDTLATAEVLVDDLDYPNQRLFISSNQRFNIGESITGLTSGAVASITNYRANPIQNIQQLLDYANVDNTTNLVLNEMQRQFMDAIPETLANGVSKRNLLKNIKDLYSAKGTSEGHKLFMRLMFDEEAEIFYPTKYMLRLSDGNWNKKSVIRCENAQGADGQEVIGQTLTGSTSGATVFVINAVTFAQGSSSITEFDIDLRYVEGQLLDGETVTAPGLITATEQKFTIQKIISEGIVNNAGILYSKGDIVSLGAGGNNAARAQVNTISVGNVSRAVIDNGGSGYRVGDQLVFTSSDSAAVAAQGYVSATGGSFLLEDNDITDGISDYLILEDSTTWQYPDIYLSQEDEGNLILVDGTDSSGTDENWFFIAETGTPRHLIPDSNPQQRITFEDGVESVNGQIAGIIVTDKGSGYSKLPSITVTSVHGSGANIVAITDNIGAILDIQVVDAGFNYKTPPEATLEAKFIVKNVTGSFSATEILTSHEGTVTNWDVDSQVLSCSIEDVVRMKMEQETSFVNENIQLEVNTDNEFNRFLVNTALESNDRQNLLDRGLDDVETTGFVVKEDYRYGGEDSLVLDADGSTKKGILLEYTPLTESQANNPNYQNSIFDANIELEQRPSGQDPVDDALFDTKTKSWTNLNTYSGAGTRGGSGRNVTLAMEGTAVGDPIVMNRSDAGGSDAGGAILEETDGDKIIQQSDNEGFMIRYEIMPHYFDLQQRKDKFQLNGTKKQVYTSGGWVDEDRQIEENLQILNSHTVMFPSLSDDSFLLEDDSGYMVLNGTSEDTIYLVREHPGVWEKQLDDGSKILGEGVVDRYVQVAHASERIVDDTDGILLEDAVGSYREFLILEGEDGSSNSDVDGNYTFYENVMGSKGNDIDPCILMETGETLLNESSVDVEGGGIEVATLLARTTGSGNRLIIDNHLSGTDVDIHLVLDGTDTEGTNGGSYLLFDGISLTERGGTSLVQESGIAAGISDNVNGDELVHETTSYVEGDILLDGIDDIGTFSGDNLINEDLINFIGKTISTVQGSAIIVGANLGKVSMASGFITTAVGEYISTDSLISEDVVRIQDSRYYQDFSYEVRIGQSVDTYMNELKRAVHPAGFMPFGKVTIASLMAVSMSSAGEGRVDPTRPTFSPILASFLSELFELKINHRLGIPKVFEPGNLFQEIRMENGTSDFKLVLDGTDYGTLLEAEEGGVIVLEESHDDGDNIIIIASDQGSQDDAGDKISLDGTDLFGTDNVDVFGEVSSIILDGSNIIDDVVIDAGESLLMDGSAFGIYNMIDADGNQLVLNGTSVNGLTPNSKVVHEDGNNVGGNIVTNSIISNSGQYFVGQENIISESSLGESFTLQDNSGRIMSEAAAGVPSSDRDNLFIRMLKVKISVPKPKALNSVGLSTFGIHNGLSDLFSDAFGSTFIQLEDALRKRGPTINASRLVLDGLDVGGKDDPADISNVGEPMEMELSQSINLGSGLKLLDFYKQNTFDIELEGTDASGTNAGDGIELETNWGGRLVSETEYISLPMADFLEPDVMLMENNLNQVSDWGRVQLDGTVSDNSLGAVDEFDFIVMNAVAANGDGDGDYILNETIDAHNKSPNGDDTTGVLLEASESPGTYILENNTNNYMLYDGIYSEIEAYTDDGTVMSLEDGGKLLTEITSARGHDIILEEGSASTVNSKLVMESQRIELELANSVGDVPVVNRADNLFFPEYTRPAEIRIRPAGRVALQDERAITEMMMENGDNIVFNRTDVENSDVGGKVMAQDNAQVILDQCAGGMLVLSGTDGSSSNAGDNITFEAGTYANLIATGKAYLPTGAEAETFDNETRTSFDSTQQTYDVVEGV